MADTNLITLTDAEIARFWSKVDRSGGPNACWPWMAGCARDGYGAFKSKGRQRRAHRVAWVLIYGQIQPGFCVCHRCDTPGCCNVEAHAFLGTQADNIADKCAKGRQANGDANGSRLYPERLARGEANTNAKLTAADVRAIRLRRAAGEYLRVLASDHGVAEATISAIARGKTWAHVHE